jgi:hypothetical protein
MTNLKPNSLKIDIEYQVKNQNLHKIVNHLFLLRYNFNKFQFHFTT